MTELRERVARALCELQIRTNRRHDTKPENLEAMLPQSIDYAWRDNLAQADAAIAAVLQDLEDGRRYRHKARGTEYTLIGVGRAQGTLHDEDSVVLYRGDDGGLWVRHQVEFSDGRFEEIPSQYRKEQASE